MKKSVLAALLVLLVVALSGCATIIKGGTSEVAFDSNPQGAEILIDGVSYGTTPLALELESDRNYNVILRSGGEEREVILRSEIGTLWIVLDVVSGLVPLIVDAATGDWYELQPADVHITFD